jgi:hypothetical protein
MEDPVTALDLAPLHGTILAIFVGVFSAYSVSLFTKLHEIRLRLFQEARRINNLPNPGWFGGMTEARKLLQNEIDAEFLEDKFIDLAMDIPSGRRNPGEGSRGIKMLEVLATIVNTYPFPQRVQSTEDGGVGIRASAKKMEFESDDEVEKWFRDLTRLLSSVTWAANTHAEKIEDALKEAQDEVSADAPSAYKRFMRFFQQAQDLAQSVEQQIEEYQETKERTPDRWKFIAIIGFSALAFVCGVVLPIFEIQTPAWVWRGIPVCVYGIFFLAVIWKVYSL